MTITLSYSRSNDCDTLYFVDTSAYGSGGNIAANLITATSIVLTDSAGNEYTYSDYLPTQGEIGLLFSNFTQTAAAEDTSDCTCCTCEPNTTDTAPDGCWSLYYAVYSGESQDTLQGTYSENLFLYCIIRNRLFDVITGGCNDCCDRERQLAINDAIMTYDIMLIMYNKQGCDCAERQLARLVKKVTNIENGCYTCY